MAHAATDPELKGAVLERRPHWSRGTDEQQARSAPRVLDAYRREATIAGERARRRRAAKRRATHNATRRER